MARTSMISVFIDSSVLYSAAISRYGASALIFALARRKKIVAYISPYVIFEVKRNISRESSKVKQRLNILLLQSNLRPSLPSEKDIDKCSQVIKTKDVPILAAAFIGKVDYLITLDREDFMNDKVKEFMKPIKIVTPKDFLKVEKIIL